jgi:hypothetical protein
MLINFSSGEIISVSDNCYKNYGLKNTLFNEKNVKKPNLNTIAPEMLNIITLNKMRDLGSETYIDTSELPEKYFFLRNYAGSDEDYHLDDKKNGKANGKLQIASKKQKDGIINES